MANVINSLKLGDGTYVFTTPYATCNTAAATAAKVATITPSSHFSLEKGARVAVQFDNANTAGSPTLNVNNTGAKAIYFKNAALTSSNYWSAKQIIDFIYDGNYWVCSAVVTDNNTDTKNTAGSTNTSNKIYLIGATSQAANPATYSHDTAYVGTDGCLYSNSQKVATVGDSNTFTGDNTFDGNNTFFTSKSYFNNKIYLGTQNDNVAELSFKDDTTNYPTPEKAYIRTVIQAGAEYNGRPTIDFVNTEGGSSRDMIALTKWDKPNEHYYRTALENFVSPNPGNTGGHAAVIAHYELDVDTGAPTNNYRAKFPLKSGTVAFTSDIDVTASGNNTFTGTNTFETEFQSSLYRTIIDKNGVSVGSGPSSGILVSTTYDYNRINYTNSGTTYTYYFPSANGTLALTSDIDVKAAGDNTFTGVNRFRKSQTTDSGDSNTSEITVDPDPANPLIRVGKTTGDMPKGEVNIGADYMEVLDVLSELFTKINLDGFEVYNSNNSTSYKSGAIINGANHTLTIPDKSGTLATTDDISNASYFNNEILFMSPAQFTQGIKDSASGSIISLPGKGGTFALTSDLPDTSNFVTLSGAQTISGNKTFNNHITLHNGPDGYLEVGSWKFFGYSLNNGTGTSLSFPSDKNGTIALTSDIPIKTATLSGTTLSITLS